MKLIEPCGCVLCCDEDGVDRLRVAVQAGQDDFDIVYSGLTS